MWKALPADVAEPVSMTVLKGELNWHIVRKHLQGYEEGICGWNNWVAPGESWRRLIPCVVTVLWLCNEYMGINLTYRAFIYYFDLHFHWILCSKLRLPFLASTLGISKFSENHLFTVSSIFDLSSFSAHVALTVLSTCGSPSSCCHLCSPNIQHKL